MFLGANIAVFAKASYNWPEYHDDPVILKA
jgi:hypothetical protein